METKYREESEYSTDHRTKRVRLTRLSDGLSVQSGWWPCDGSAEQSASEKMRMAEASEANRQILEGVRK